MTADECDAVLLRMTADELTVIEKGFPREPLKFRIDWTKRPATIDVDFAVTNQTRRGILQLDGVRLKLCIASPGSDRPNAFASADDAPTEYMELMRVKTESNK